MRLKFPILSLLDHQNMPKPIPHFSIFLKKSKSPIQKSCDTSQNFCMGFWETPALAECLCHFIFLKLASSGVCSDEGGSGVQLYLSIVDFPIETPFRTFIWNHALELLKDYTHHTLPLPLPLTVQLLWLKMTFLDQNILNQIQRQAIQKDTDKRFHL